MKIPANILVIEDDDAYRKTLVKTLNKEGYACKEAKNGEESIKISQNCNFDMVVADVRLPGGVDGVEIVKEIKEKSGLRNIKVIIITGYAETDAPIRAIKIKVDDYLMKPFELEKFLNVVKNNLEKVINEKEVEDILGAGFKKKVISLKKYLVKIKVEFDGYEKNFSEDKQIKVLVEKKEEIFLKLDKLFDDLWEEFKDLPKNLYDAYRHFYEKELIPYLHDGIDTNSYIRNKPLGYAGDFVTMNFIYDYFDNKFMGESLYSKLINHYTCNINVSYSNIFRKRYLKDRIEKILFEKENPSILSVGCGPAREIIELIKEGKIDKPITIDLLDLEKKAVSFVKEQLDKLDYPKNKIKINIHLLDLIEIIKSKKVKELFKDIDLIYVSGVYDYLSDRVARRVLKSLYEIIKDDGEIIVFNMSLENARHRAYYEVFGDWVMNHRTKGEVLSWADKLDNAESFIVDYPECKCYWILKVNKK